MAIIFSLLPFLWGEIMSILRYVQSFPHITVVGTYTDKRTVIIPPLEFGDTSQTGAFPPAEYLKYHSNSHKGENRVEEYWFSHVRFENKKRLRIDTRTATNVMAHLTFFSEDGRDILGTDFFGRWGNSVPQPKSIDELEMENDKHWVDMLPNSSQYELDLVMKYESESVCFAFNNKNYLRPEFRTTWGRLDGKKFSVRVALRGSNIDPQEFWFTLINHGKGGGLEIKQESKISGLAKGKFSGKYTTA